MRNIFIIGFTLLAFIVKANNPLLNKIERKLERNYATGLEYAEKLKKQRIKEPAPYYVIARHNMMLFASEPAVHHQIRLISKIPRDLIKARTYAVGYPSVMPLLDSLSQQVLPQLARLRDSLLVDGRMDEAERFAEDYYRLSGVKLPSLEEIEAAEDAKLQAEKKALKVPQYDGTIYHGMPKGTEDVKDSLYLKATEFLAILNKARIQRNLEPLTMMPDLNRAARYHAYDMATEKYFSHNTHDRIKGELVEIGGAFERIKKFYSGSFVNSENIAAGSSTANDTYYQWFTSKGHNANMFKKDANYIGVGVFYDPQSPYGYYWVMCTAR